MTRVAAFVAAMLLASPASAQWASSRIMSGEDMFVPYTRHVQIAAGSLSGATIPTPTQWGTSAVLYLAFANTGTDYAFTQVELTNDWEEGTAVNVEIDWFPVAQIDNTQTVEVDICYTVANEGSAIASTDCTVVEGTYTADGNIAAGTNIHTGHTIPAVALAKGNHLFVRVQRNTADTYTGVVGVTALEYIYSSTSLPRD